MTISLLTQKVSTIFGVKKHNKTYVDAFGVEIEVEPNNPTMRPSDFFSQNEAYTRNWSIKSDGSLRNNGYEIISKVMNEYEIDQAKVSYNESFPWRMFSTTSPRTSVHVHLNFSQNYLFEVITFFCHMLLIEDIVAEYCGKTRKGNLFALESGKSLSNYNNVKELITKQDYRFGNNDYRYTAINLESLSRLGTVEVRTMRGLTNIDEVFDWVTILVQIKKLCTNKTPNQIDFSNLLPKELLDFCKDSGIDYQEKINSQLSLFYDLMSSHPTSWDFSNPNCDWRNTPGIKEYCFINWDRNVEILLSYDYYKKFKRNNTNQERPFEPRGPLPVLNQGNNLEVRIQPRHGDLVLIDDAANPGNVLPRDFNWAENRFANVDIRDLLVQRGNNQQNVIDANFVAVDEIPDDVQPDVELDDFDFDIDIDEEHPNAFR
jgi:hypothetical protein